MDINKDYYAILGILPTAELETINAVYRVLSKKHHPDVTKDIKSEQLIREINEAYDVLSNPKKRILYDNQRSHDSARNKSSKKDINSQNIRLAGANMKLSTAKIHDNEFDTNFKAQKSTAEVGDADAQFGLGYCYYYGQGVPENDEAAVKWFTLAAEQEQADAQYFLGLCYYNGQGVPENDETAVKWFTLAAEQEQANAQYFLGLCYCSGQGVPENHETAVKWFTLAAEQEQANAQYSLGKSYVEGKGVPVDFAMAVKWLTLAADEEQHGKDKIDKNAQVLLDIIYKNGINGAQNQIAEEGKRTKKSKVIFFNLLLLFSTMAIGFYWEYCYDIVVKFISMISQM